MCLNKSWFGTGAHRRGVSSAPFLRATEPCFSCLSSIVSANVVSADAVKGLVVPWPLAQVIWKGRQTRCQLLGFLVVLTFLSPFLAWIIFIVSLWGCRGYYIHCINDLLIKQVSNRIRLYILTYFALESTQFFYYIWQLILLAVTVV